MISVKDSAEFTRLLEALARDIVDAHIHFRMHQDLRESLKEHNLVVIQSNTFWALTLKAHLNLSLLLLSRVYDQNPKSLHLYSWLLTIKDNLKLFREKHFRKRLKNNPFVDSLARSLRKPDEAILKKDIMSCSTADPLVKTLLIHRGSRIAHRSAKNVLSQINIGNKHPLTFGNLETLLKRSITIMNRYSSLFAANTYFTQITGHDDYDYIIESVEACVKKARASRKRR